MTIPNSQNAYVISGATSSTVPFLTIFSTVDPTAYDIQYPIGKRWINTTSDEEFYLKSFDSSSGVVLANWQDLQNSVAAETLTGNSGGAVAPDGSNNINILGATGQIAIAGNPGTNTLTASLNASVAQSFITDSGTATPAANALSLLGTPSLISTSGSGSTVTFDLDGSVSNSFVTNSGTATPVGGVLNIVGTATSGIISLGSGDTVTLGMNSPFVGDFSFRSVSSGDILILTAENTSDTASSEARFEAKVAGTSAGDPWNQWTVGTSRAFSYGIDNSDSQSIKLTTTNSATISPSLGTLLQKVSTAGIFTQPLQPAFLAVLTVSTTGGVTGGGPSWTMASANGATLTEIFDQGSNFDPSTGTFTCPADGLYLFHCEFRLNSLDVTMTNINVNIASNSYVFSGADYFNPGTARNVANDLGLGSCSALIPLLATESVSCNVVISGGANDVNVQGGSSATPVTYFYGIKVA